MTTLLAMGGAINKDNPAVMREYLRRAGEEDARIVILPQASSLADTGQSYVKEFEEMGAGQAVTLEFRTRAEAGTQALIELLRNATGILSPAGPAPERRYSQKQWSPMEKTVRHPANG
jgi:cyanophycinase